MFLAGPRRSTSRSTRTVPPPAAITSMSKQYHHRQSSTPLFHWLLVGCVAAISFFAGTLWTVQAVGLDTQCLKQTKVQQQQTIDDMVEQKLKDLKAKLPKCVGENNNNDTGGSMNAARIMTANKKESSLFTTSTHSYAVAMARTPKDEFTKLLDLGVPLDRISPDAKDVMILYQHPYSKPNGVIGDDAPLALSAEKAVENCDAVNVVLTAYGQGSKHQCIAIVPQYESYHIQKWMRVHVQQDGKDDGEPILGAIDKQSPLRMVARSYQDNGRDQFGPPIEKHIRQHWDLMDKYMDEFDAAMARLKPLAAKVATRDNIVTVMVCNLGQSELLVNFVCAAKRRNLDISSVLVFATDEETKELAENMGLTAYYDEKNFGEMPAEAAGGYGDRKFTAMMMAKVICVQMVSWLGYDVLFQDVDIVWYKNPLDYFRAQDKQFDMYFQDDGARTVRYAPYSANSGFYYVRHNDRTKWFFTALLEQGPVILKTNSHQQALIALMDEFVSLYGMSVKVLSRDDDEFPGGFHYHMASGKYMKRLFSGEADPYLFHMSWTKNKDNKLLFLRQMGEWYVQDACLGGDGSTVVKKSPSTCCSVEPLISCHYIDKPSKHPCPDSPRIDPQKKKSFW